MKFKISFILAATICRVASAQEAQLQSVDGDFSLQDGLAASVNGQAITLSEVRSAVPSFIPIARAEADPAEGTEQILFRAFKLALNSLEDRLLVIQEYEKGDLKVPDNVVDRVAASILEERFGGDMQKLQQHLADTRMTYTEWKEQRKQAVILASMRTTFVSGNVHVSPKEVADAYAADPTKWAPTGEIKGRLAAFDSESVCNEFLAGLATGAQFSDLAKKYSLDANAADGGDYGWITAEEEWAPPLAKAALALNDGEISSPIPLGGMIFLVFREDSRPGQVPSLNDAWDEIEATLRQEREDALWERWIGHLRQKASIREFISTEK